MGYSVYLLVADAEHEWLRTVFNDDLCIEHIRGPLFTLGELSYAQDDLPDDTLAFGFDYSGSFDYANSVVAWVARKLGRSEYSYDGQGMHKIPCPLQWWLQPWKRLTKMQQSNIECVDGYFDVLTKLLATIETEWELATLDHPQLFARINQPSIKP